MQTRSGAEIVVDGDVVYKLHRPGTDPRALTTRLRVAAESGRLLSPLDTRPEPVGMRWRTCWPKVEVVVPQPEFLPWAQAGRLLAKLHREAVPVRMPPHGWPLRLRRMLRSADDPIVRRAAAAFSERELGQVIAMALTINAWNRIGVTTRLPLPKR